MLIDPAPDPAPGKRIVRDAPSRASELPDERADSFGAILARFDRAPAPDRSLPPVAEAPRGEPDTESGPPEAAQETAHAPEREAQARPERGAGDETFSPTQRHRDGNGPPVPEIPGASSRIDARIPSRPDADALPPIPTERKNAAREPWSRAEARPGDGVARDRVSSGPASLTGAALPESPRASERTPGPALPAAQPGAEAHPSSAPDLTQVAAPRSARPAEGIVQPEASQPPPSTAVRAVPETAAPTPPAPAIVESVLKARLSESGISGPRIAGAVASRVFDGGAGGFGLGLGEPGVPTVPTDSTVERLLRAAPSANVEVARDLAQQIGARIMPLARGQFELALAPAELGRLEIALREVDGVMTLSVTAERPETLDLIRRHVDLLAQELRQMAQRELLLQLGTGGTGAGSGGPNARASDQGADSDAIALADALPSDAPPVIPRDHLDLRL
jgi:flagellar hook-length control protein FliK